VTQKRLRGQLAYSTASTFNIFQLFCWFNSI